MTQEQGRSVPVTGGMGIGPETALILAQRSDRAATYSTTTPLPGETFLRMPGDVASAEQIDDTVKEVEEAHASVEVLLANAGVTDDQLLFRTSKESFTVLPDPNLTGACRTARRPVTGTTRATQGCVIPASSAAGLRGEAGQPNCAASKTVLVGPARSLGP